MRIILSILCLAYLVLPCDAMMLIAGRPLTTPADVTAPEVSSATINGTAVVLNFTESVSQGTNYLDTYWNIDGGTMGNDIGLTCVSCTGSSWSLTSATAAVTGESVDLDFVPGATADIVEDGAGNDLAAITSLSITNNTPDACAIHDYAVAASTEGYGYVGRYEVNAFIGEQVKANVNNICSSRWYIYETEAGSFSGKYYNALIYTLTTNAITNPSAPSAYSTFLDATTISGTQPGVEYTFNFNTTVNVTADGHAIVLAQFRNLDVGDASWAASTGDTGAYYYDTTPTYNPTIVFFEGVPLTKGTAGALNNGEWAFTDQDSIGANRLYVQLASGDPDNESTGDLKRLDIDGSVFAKVEYTNGVGGTLDSGFGQYANWTTSGSRNTIQTGRDFYYSVYKQ